MAGAVNIVSGFNNWVSTNVQVVIIEIGTATTASNSFNFVMKSDQGAIWFVSGKTGKASHNWGSDPSVGLPAFTTLANACYISEITATLNWTGDANWAVNWKAKLANGGVHFT
ncbi:hypothetical protein BKA93DRAFT_824145 [Sparassis latifolia]